MNKYLLAGLALVLVLVILNWAGLFSQATPEAVRRPPTSLTVAKARIDTLYDRVEALGTTLEAVLESLRRVQDKARSGEKT